MQQYNAAGKVVRSGLFSSRDREFRNNSVLFTEFDYFPRRWDDINSDGNGSFKIHDQWQTGFFIANDRANKLNLGLGVFYRGEDLGGHRMEYNLELTWRPSDRFSFILNLGFEDIDGWLINEEGRDFTTFSSTNWRPRIETDFFFSAKQQFRISAQWVGIKAFEQDRWKVPLSDGNLKRVPTIPGSSSRDFSISRLVFQARYRWEIAPLSDLFVVYTRGSDVPTTHHKVSAT